MTFMASVSEFVCFSFMMSSFVLLFVLFWMKPLLGLAAKAQSVARAGSSPSQILVGHGVVSWTFTRSDEG
jgi:hypothetical protein